MRRFAVVALLAFQATACGGSSSETPPPLEPDPARLRGASRDGETPGSAGPGEDGSTLEPGQEAPIPAISEPGTAAPSTPAPSAPAPSTVPARRGRSTEPSSTWGAASPPPELAPLPQR